MFLVTLSNIFLEHAFTYETAKKHNFMCFIISKFKMMQLELAKQSMQKSVCIIKYVTFGYVYNNKYVCKCFRKYYKMIIWR